MLSLEVVAVAAAAPVNKLSTCAEGCIVVPAAEKAFTQAGLLGLSAHHCMTQTDRNQQIISS